MNENISLILIYVAETMCVFYTFWLAFVIFAFSLFASEFIIVRLTYCVSFTIIIMQTHKKKNNKINKLITCYIDYFLTSSLYFRLLVKGFTREIRRTNVLCNFYQQLNLIACIILNLPLTLEGIRSAS